MKKAFTLSEALVTMAIIGVLAAILVPAVDQVRPDKDKVTYKKALYSMQNAVSSAMDTISYNYAANVDAYWKNSEDGTFCRSLAEAFNTTGTINCESSSYENPNFITTDGIRYWGLEGGFDGNDHKTIYVDRKLSSGELNIIGDRRKKTEADGVGLQIRVRYDGKIDVPDTDEASYEKELIENSMDMTSRR